MKKFMVGFLLFVLGAVSISWGQGVTPVPTVSIEKSAAIVLTTDVDYSWNKHVTAKYGTAEFKKQHDECVEWKKVVDQAQADGKSGKYDDVIKLSPLSRQKAWAALNKLRTVMGGSKDENGHWSGYKVDADNIFTGSDSEIKAALSLAQDVKDYVAAAVKAGLNKDMNGLDCADAATWADSYLYGMLDQERPSDPPAK